MNESVRVTTKTFDKFNDWGGGVFDIFVTVLRGKGTKIDPTGDRFDQGPHVGEHVVSSPEGAVLVTSPGTKSSYPRPP